MPYSDTVIWIHHADHVRSSKVPLLGLPRHLARHTHTPSASPSADPDKYTVLTCLAETFAHPCSKQRCMTAKCGTPSVIV